MDRWWHALSTVTWKAQRRRYSLLSAVVLTAVSLMWYFVGIGLIAREGSTSTPPLVIIGCVIGVLAQGVALALRRQRPGTTFLVILGIMLVITTVQERAVAANPSYLMSIIGLGLYAAPPRLLANLALGTLGIAADSGIQLLRRPPVDDVSTMAGTASAILGNVIITYAVCIGVGLAVTAYRVRLRSAQESILRLHEQRAEETAAAVASERQRMARELHDISAHHVTAIVIQSKSALLVVRDDDEQTRQHLVGIRDQGERAMTSLRNMIGLLRLEDSAGFTPQPTIHELPRLVDGVDGLTGNIELRTNGDLSRLSDAVQLACFRIVQEALSNIVKYAPDVDVTVDVSVDQGTVFVMVENGPFSGLVDTADSQGFGLVGLKERAELLGGQFSAGPTTCGGWQVKATMSTQGETS